MNCKLIHTPNIVMFAKEAHKLKLGNRIHAYQQSIETIKITLNAFDVSEADCLGKCIEHSATWYLMLNQSFPVNRIMAVTPRYNLQNWYHLFLEDREFDEPIIIDPTYRQLIRDAVELDHLPDIFVGTPKELISIFAKHKDRLRFGTKDLSSNSYDPTEFYNMAYANGIGDRVIVNGSALEQKSDNLPQLSEFEDYAELGQFYSQVP